MGDVAVVVGAGPRLGAAVARRFTREGARVAVLARRPEALRAVAGPIGALAVVADTADPESLSAGFATIRESLGEVTALVFNTGTGLLGPPSQMPYREFAAALTAGVAGFLLATQQVLPAMRRAGRGTILLTGTGQAVRPMAAFGAVGPQKAAARALALVLAEELAEDGVHVATVTVRGAIEPGTGFDPDRIAEEYWALHTEPRESWRTEVVYTGREP